MLSRAFVLLCLVSGCASTHASIDAADIDAATIDAAAIDAATHDAVAIDAPEPDTGVECTSFGQPDDGCDLPRGVCCETGTRCNHGHCRYPDWECSGELGYCFDREDCCNARHSCIGNQCMY